MFSVFMDFFRFFKKQRKLWLLPLVLVLLLLGLVFIAASTTVVAPLIYTLF